MAIDYQLEDVGEDTVAGLAASLDAERPGPAGDVLAVGDFWSGAGPAECREFITKLGLNFHAIYHPDNRDGQRC